MYNFFLKGITNKYEYDDLIKVFLKPEEYIIQCNSDLMSSALIALESDKNIEDFVLEFDETEKNALKQQIYIELSKLTGKSPEWGIHTGVRPVKLVGELYRKLGLIDEVSKKLKDYYLFNDEKNSLVCDIYKIQQNILGGSDDNAVGIYIGIPFCPTRCLYCSFTSNQVSEDKIQEYLDALHIEIEYVGKRMAENGLYPESIYIGGGTPTTISVRQMDKLLMAVYKHFDFSKIREFTVEAGRPDTITSEKLAVIKSNGVGRISINPQSMKNKTLDIIGRSHNRDAIINAFELARKSDISIINADIIAGLPEESLEDFTNTLDATIGLGAENITVHTLAVKRASRLIDVDSNFHYKQAKIVKEMLALSKQRLFEEGYNPYYLYRQKHMAGSLENVGFSKEGSESIYNIRIMEERQTIIALGAGGITKVYYPAENRLERVPNVSNYEIYISRLNEMLKRKDDNLFRR